VMTMSEGKMTRTPSMIGTKTLHSRTGSQISRVSAQCIWCFYCVVVACSQYRPFHSRMSLEGSCKIKKGTVVDGQQRQLRCQSGSQFP
jgi:hypothetical protein